MSRRARTLLLLGLAIAALAAAAVFEFASTAPSSSSLVRGLEAPSIPEEPPLQLSEYMEVVGGCDSAYAGGCVVARTSPNASSSIAAQLRTGMVLRVANTVETDGETWYKIGFDSWIRYPGRITGEWYVEATSSVRISEEVEEENLVPGEAASSTKRILVDRSDQTLTAYDGDEVFMETSVSTGLALTPTPRGTFTVYRKTPARYMQGPLPGVSDQYYDLPGVSWNLYFTLEGGVIHGAYWHESFGKPWSHGCVNLVPDDAHVLYHWADVGTEVVVRD